MPVSTSRITQGRKWILAPDGWDTAWKAARSASGSSPAKVLVLGDSNSQGYQSTDHMAKSFVYLIRNALVAKYGSCADFYSVMHSARFIVTTGYSIAPTGTQPWTMDTTFGASGSNFHYGLGCTMFQDSGTFPQTWLNAGNAVFVSPYSCTDMDIIWHDWNTTGTWKYNIDNAVGGGLVTVTCDGRNSVRRTSITGQTNAVHTVRFGGASVTLAAGLNGVVCYNVANAKTKGISFANMSGLGFRMYDWQCANNAIPADRIQQLQGRSKTAVATEILTGFGFPTQPHLTIIELGINDCQQSGGLVQFRIGLRRLCEALRRGQANASILFLVCANPAIATTDMTQEFVHATSWSSYVDNIYGVAAEYNCGVYNVHANWMSTPVASGYLTATDAHPTDVGHQAIADTILPLII